MCTAPILQMLADDKPFWVEVDASDYAIGAVLSQQTDNKWHLVAYMSKALSETKHNYEIYDKEILAIMLVLDEWQQYLMGVRQKFKIWTDHQNLQYFWQPQKLNCQQACWITELAEYNFVLMHKPGKTHLKPDLKRGERQQKHHLAQATAFLTPRKYNGGAG